jgi:hypothetical protein
MARNSGRAGVRTRPLLLLLAALLLAAVAWADAAATYGLAGPAVGYDAPPIAAPTAPVRANP